MLAGLRAPVSQPPRSLFTVNRGETRKIAQKQKRPVATLAPKSLHSGTNQSPAVVEEDWDKPQERLNVLRLLTRVPWGGFLTNPQVHCSKQLEHRNWNSVSQPPTSILSLVWSAAAGANLLVPFQLFIRRRVVFYCRSK